MKNRKKIAFFLIFIIIVIIVVGLFLGYKLIYNLYPKKYTEVVEKYSKEYNVDENLIYAIIKEESNFENDASSSKSAIGLMQLMESTAEEVALELEMEEIDLTDADTNIKIGTKYISDLIEKYNGNIELAIVAYNAGIGNVDSWIKDGIINETGDDLENIPYKETNMYVRKVLRTYNLYNKLY